MKVVAMLGGLGSQMLKYAFYLQICDDELCYIDTTSYLLNKMWNGYELDKIFGIFAPDIRDFWTSDDIEIFQKEGINYKETGIRGILSIEKKKKVISFLRGYCYTLSSEKVLNFACLAFNKVKRLMHYNDNVGDTYPFFYHTKLVSFFYDEFNHTSDTYIGGSEAKERLKTIYRFPDFDDNKNIFTREQMLHGESVAVHIRRSDHMYDNGRLFEKGYFRKAIQDIKNCVNDPVFYVFSDEPKWCMDHGEQLGFEETDHIVIVDWNEGKASYRDMQLMTYCRHNVLSISSFGWWGYYLSCREGKRVYAPKGYWHEVPIHY